MKNLTPRILCLFHEARRKRSWYLKNAIDAIGQHGRHPTQRFVRKELPIFPFAAVCEHRVKFRQRRCAADSAEGDNRLRADGDVVHRADRVQPVRRRECFARQRARRN